jgi:glycerol transport system ATP-binding protein
MSLELQNVQKRSGKDVHIYPTSLMLEAGSMNVLLGRTLSGKTTLMRIMAGLDVPDEGRVLWQGEDVTGRRVQTRDVAMVYQQFINYPSMTVYENIASPLKLRRVAANEIDARVRSAAELMKLGPDLLARRPLELSGGQQQRCALARALVKDAGLVLLDEPLANLDYKLREEIRSEIPKIFSASGAIFVYATTEPHEALLLGGNTACLWEGQLTQFGPTPEVYRAPQDAQTASIFSDPPMNFFEAELSAGELSYPNGRIAMRDERLQDGAYRAGFRANHLSLAEIPDGLSFETTCVGTEITGAESYVHLSTGWGHWVARLGGIHPIDAGETVRAHVSPENLYIFHEDGRLAARAPATGAH